MTRMIRNVASDITAYTMKPSECTLAPHRYTDDHDNDYRWDRSVAPDYRAWKAAVPYKPGDVVMIEHWGTKVKSARRALILGVFIDRDWSDRNPGDRMEKYRITLETTDDRWAKLYSYTWPGHIQRGYMMMNDKEPT